MFASGVTGGQIVDPRPIERLVVGHAPTPAAVSDRSISGGIVCRSATMISNRRYAVTRRMLATQRSIIAGEAIIDALARRVSLDWHRLGMIMLTVGCPTTLNRTQFSPADGPTSTCPGLIGAT